MNLVLVGSDYFRSALEGSGVHVYRLGSEPDSDIRVPAGDFHLPAALSMLPEKPDAIILTDQLSRRVLPSGLDEIDVLKVWYGVDGPLNAFWHVHYAPLFDLVLADQKDCAARLSRSIGRPVHWLPVAVNTDSYAGPAETKVFDIAFVGVLNDRVRPKRSRIIERLSKRYVVKTTGGRFMDWVGPRESARLYRQSRLVLNENLFDGVTTRMFESLASGSMLLTESAQNGFTDIFQAGKHLDVFQADNLLERVDDYLRDDTRREKIAEQGRQLVVAHHDIRNRAADLLCLIDSAKRGSALNSGGEWLRMQGMAWLMAGLRWPAHDGPRRILEAEKILLKAAHAGASNADSLFYLGCVAWIKGNRTGARVRWGESAERGDVRGGIALGRMAITKGDYTEAAKHFQRAATSFGLDFPFGSDDDSTSNTHYFIGRVLELAGHVLDPGFSKSGLDPVLWNAAEHYQAALLRNPDHAPSLTALGRILTDHGAFVEAYPLLHRARSIKPKDEYVAVLAEAAARRAYLEQEAA